VGGFGLTSAEDLLLVQDILLIQQQVSAVTVAFDDTAVADLFEDLVEQGHQPEEFGRIWIHTHPGDCPAPSGTDEQTFERVFGACDWAVMFILARNGETYARLRFGVGPGGEMEIPVQVDFSQPFGPSDQAAWTAEYDAKVHAIPLSIGSGIQSSGDWNDHGLEALLEGYEQRGRGGRDGDGYDEF
jgi:hypothetical protein